MAAEGGLCDISDVALLKRIRHAAAWLEALCAEQIGLADAAPGDVAGAINLVDARTFQYLGDTTVGERGTVKTKVLTKRGSAIDVEYLVRATPPARRWHVQDVRVEMISLVDNYRAQFDAIISRASYEELVKRLRAAVK